MKESVSFKNLLLALLFGFAGFASAFVPILLIPAVALIVFVAICWSRSCALLVLVPTAAGAFIANLSGWTQFVPMLVLVVGSALILIAGFRKKLPYRYIAVGLALLCFACLYCYISLDSIRAGKEPYAPLTEGLDRLAELYRATGVTGSAEIAESIRDVSDGVPTVFYGMLVLVSQASAFLTLILAKAMCRAKKSELAPMAKLSEWQLPPSLRIALPVLAVAVIVLYLAKISAAQTVMYTVVYTLMPMFAVAGFGCMLIIAERRGRTFVKVFAIIMLIISPFFTAMIGVFDLYSGIRRRMLKIDRLVKEAFERAEKEHRNTVTVDFGDGRGPQVIAVRKERIEDAFFDNGTEDAQHTDNTENKTEENTSDNPENGLSKDETAENSGDTSDFSDHENGGGEA